VVCCEGGRRSPRVPRSVCFAHCFLPCLPLLGPVTSSPDVLSFGLVPRPRSFGKKDWLFGISTFVETQVGAGGISHFSSTQPLPLAAVHELDLIFFMLFAICHLFGGAILSWFPWRDSRALLYFSMFLTNPFIECFSLVGVMGEECRPVSSPSMEMLISFLISFSLDLDLHDYYHKSRAETSSLENKRGSLRRINCFYERIIRLIAFHQPCKLGDCDGGCCELDLDSCIRLKDPWILNGSSCNARVGFDILSECNLDENPLSLMALRASRAGFPAPFYHC